MRKLFTIETSSEKEWNEVRKSIKESLSDACFIEFVISVACRIYSLNVFKEWLDALSRECNNSDFYQFWRIDDVEVFDTSVRKNIIFRKAYKDEEIGVIKEQRNGYTRRVEEPEEALKEYQYGIAPSLKEKCKNQETEILCLKEKCKNQAAEILYLRKKIDKLRAENKELEEKRIEIIHDRDAALSQLENEKADLLARIKSQNGRYPWGISDISKSMNIVDQVNAVIHIINRKFNEVDGKLNDVSSHLQELDKFRDSIKKEGDNKYD